MTPRETWEATSAAAWRHERELERMLSLAWHTAALSRARRMPGLKELLRGLRKSKEDDTQDLAERRREFQEKQGMGERVNEWLTNKRMGWRRGE